MTTEVFVMGLILYCVVTIVVFMIASEARYESPTEEESMFFSRIVSLSPVWPLLLIALIVAIAYHMLTEFTSACKEALGRGVQ